MPTTNEIRTEVAKHPSVRAAARSMGIPESTLRGRLAKSIDQADVGAPIEVSSPEQGFIVKKNAVAYDADGNLTGQWIQTASGPGEVYQVPKGHMVKGESTLVDPSGRVLAQWIKTREGAVGQGLVEALQTTFAAYKGASPFIPAPTPTDDTLLTVYPIADLHLGLYSWGEETGSDYDVDIALNMARVSIGQLVAQSRPSKHAVILGLGDMFHQNDQKNATPGSGHRLDVDGRWSRVFEAGARLMVDIVDLVAQKHEQIDVVMIPGNHDEDAAVCLRVALSLFYAKNPRVNVYNRPGLHWFKRFGNCLLGATHGHAMKPDRMAMMMATDCSKDWGETEHRAMYFGHIHHESLKEVGPVRVESFSTPAAKDAYAAGGGYRSSRAMSAITWHSQFGEIGRHRVNISDRSKAA